MENSKNLNITSQIVLKLLSENYYTNQVSPHAKYAYAGKLNNVP